jgi:hypothetical protein
MKSVLATFSLLLISASPLIAQNYQPQYPYDPYSSAPHPQPKAAATTTPVTNSDYAQLLSYGSLQVNYSFLDFKSSSIFKGSNGLSADLRLPLFRPLFLDFGADWHSGTDANSHSFSFTGLNAAAGVYIPVASRFHLFAELGVKYDSTDGSLNSIHPDVFAVFARPGMRIALSDSFELAASVYFANTKNFDDHVIEINGYYALLSILDLGAGIDFNSDANAYHVGLRLRW